jgi:hypothetical protein
MGEGSREWMVLVVADAPVVTAGWLVLVAAISVPSDSSSKDTKQKLDI